MDTRTRIALTWAGADKTPHTMRSKERIPGRHSNTEVSRVLHLRSTASMAAPGGGGPETFFLVRSVVKVRLCLLHW